MIRRTRRGGIIGAIGVLGFALTGPVGAVTATPKILPPAGTYGVAQKVTVSDATSGAVLYFTTNGATPTSASTRYTGAITIGSTSTLKVVAIAAGQSSQLAVATYTIEPVAASPKISPAGGTFNTSQTVNLSDATAGVSIRYTLNGSVPTTASALYSGAIRVAQTEVLKAIAIKPGYLSSPVASANFTIAPITETVLHDFPSSTTDGDYPSGLLLASDGNYYGTTPSGGAYSVPFGGGNGTVFKITPGGVYSIVHSFTGGVAGSTDGQFPMASLIEGRDGNLYGTTSGGGKYGAGTVFKLTLAGAESILYHFASVGRNTVNGNTDGSDPRASLVQANNGILYGTTFRGGANGGGVVFSLTTGGVYKVLHAFGSAYDPSGSGSRASLIQASDGNLYGTTSGGGDATVGVVFRMTLNGVETVLHSFARNQIDGNAPYANVIQGKDGFLYGTTSYGGKYSDNGTVFRLSTQGAYNILYQFGTRTGDGRAPLSALMQARDGFLYGTVRESGSLNWGAVFRLSTAGALTLPYSFNGNTGVGAGPETALIEAKDGSLYGSTNQGGTKGHGVVFKLKNVVQTAPAATEMPLAADCGSCEVQAP